MTISHEIFHFIISEPGRCPESQQRSTNPIHDGIDQIPEQIHNAFSSQIREADIIPETAWLSII